jgi:hypothetical protein
MGANTADAKDAILSISDETNGRRLKTSLRRRDMANITARDRGCWSQMTRNFSLKPNTMTGIVLRKTSRPL